MKKLKPIHGFVVFLSIYAFLGIINLEILPVAWNDEVQNLDPAVQKILTGTFKSIIWPNPGADKMFASYPPLIQYVHYVWLTIFSIHIFTVRLPFLILTLATFFLFYHTLNRNKHLNNTWLPLLLLLIFALDKSTFELSRSVRVEPIILFLLSLYLFIQPKRLPFTKITLIAISSTAHFYIWPILFVWFAFEWLKLPTVPQKLLAFLILIAPWAFYFHSLDYQFSTWYNQMSMQTLDHQITSTDLPHSAFENSLFYRFWPHYKEQPFNVILFWAILIITTILFFTKKPLLKPQYQNLTALFFFSALLFAFASPQYRYLPPMLLLALITLPQLPWLNFQTKFIHYFSLLLAINGFFSFGGRHLAAQIQKTERNPYQVYDFLSEHLPTDKSLLIGDAIGAYYTYSVQKYSSYRWLDYAFDYYPIYWQPYKKVYIITHNTLPNSKFIQFIAEYRPVSSKQLPNWALKFAKGQTYSGMKLYQLK